MSLLIFQYIRIPKLPFLIKKKCEEILKALQKKFSSVNFICTGILRESMTNDLVKHRFLWTVRSWNVPICTCCQFPSLHLCLIYVMYFILSRVYNIGIEVKQGKGQFRNTNIVTFAPRYEIDNQSGHKLAIAQRHFTNKEVWVYSCSVFWY